MAAPESRPLARREGRPFVVAWQEDAATLRAAYRGARDPQLRPRLHALWLLRGGRALGEVVQVVGVHYRTVQQWVAWYRAGGLAAVRAHRTAGRGQPARLTPAQQAALLERAAAGAFYSVADAVAWVQDTFGVPYRPQGMYTLLRRLRLKKKVPRPVNPKADPARQAAWKGGTSRRPSARPASAPGSA
jgi:transposase